MSNDALTWAWKARIPDGPKFVLVALADHASDHAGEDWTCFPSVDRLIERTSKSRSTVERHLKWLDDNGWISRRRRRRADGTLGIYDFTLRRDKVSAATPIEARAAARQTSDCRVDHTSNDPSTTRQMGPQPHVNLTQQEPSLEPSEEPSQGARASGDAVGRDLGELGSDGEAAIQAAVGEALELWATGKAGKSTTKPPLVARLWSDAAAGAGGGAALLGCIRAFLDDPTVRSRTHGVGGLQNWLRDENWRMYLLAATEGGKPAATGVFPDAAIRAEVVRLLGPGDGPSAIDHCGWDAERRVVIPRTSWQATKLAKVAKLSSADLDWTIGEIGRG